MKTIEEAKTEFSNKKAFVEKGIEIEVGAGFISGVQFAQRWIPITEELPEIKENPYQVIAKRVLQSGDIHYETVYISSAETIQSQMKMYTHWRTIEFK